MFLSGVEESAAIAEVGDSGGLSKIAGRPVREARPKAADVRRGRRREKAGPVGTRKQTWTKWSGVARPSWDTPQSLSTPSSLPSSPLHAQKLCSSTVKNTYIQYLPTNERNRIDDGGGICKIPSGRGLHLGDMERGEAAQVSGSFDTCSGGCHSRHFMRG